MVALVTDILSLFTVFGGLIIIYCLLAALLNRFGIETIPGWDKVRETGKRYGLWFAFIVALIATLGSLFYSEVAGYNPCKLCWIQRIFMYPLAIIFGAAVWPRKWCRWLPEKIKDSAVFYGLVFSIIGAPIAAYHYYLQRWGGSDTPCSAVGYSESCAQNFVLTFGYITIPMMALTAFLLIALSLYFYRSTSKNTSLLRRILRFNI